VRSGLRPVEGRDHPTDQRAEPAFPAAARQRAAPQQFLRRPRCRQERGRRVALRDVFRRHEKIGGGPTSLREARPVHAHGALSVRAAPVVSEPLLGVTPKRPDPLPVGSNPAFLDTGRETVMVGRTAPLVRQTRQNRSPRRLRPESSRNNRRTRSASRGQARRWSRIWENGTACRVNWSRIKRPLLVDCCAPCHHPLAVVRRPRRVAAQHRHGGCALSLPR